MDVMDDYEKALMTQKNVDYGLWNARAEAEKRHYETACGK
jgi:hypothetical protein